MLRHEVQAAYESAVRNAVEDAIARLAGAESLIRDVRRIARRRASRTISRGTVRDRLEAAREQPWRAVAGVEAIGQLHGSGVDIDRLVAELLRKRLDELTPGGQR